jgi:pimeloyl-ACP methyl ester carboxylesterase
MAPSSEAQRITFTTEDEVELVGYFYPTWKPNAPVLVLMHQRYGTQRMWFDEKSSLVQWLQNWPTADGAEPTPSSQGMLPVLIPELGYNVFTVDFRGHGESAGSLPADPQTYLIDARAAYKAARSLPGVHPRQVLGFGTSIGADAVVDACENLCAGAFSISPGSWLNVDYAQAARQMLDAGKPIRCMYAINDHPSPATCESVPRSHLYQVFAYAGSKHGMTFLVPRKMEMDFGPNLINFILQATEK